MIRVSSNGTIFLRIFVPIFLLVFYFFGVMAIWLNAFEGIDFPLWFKISNSIFFISLLLIFWQTTWRLHRVELGSDHVYISNYIKTVRYSYESIKDCNYYSFLLWKIGYITLLEKGILGKRIFFLLTSKKESLVHLDEMIAYLDPISSVA